MIYLDNAATTYPKPARVNEKVIERLTNGIGSPGRGEHAYALNATNEVADIRKNFAKFFGLIDDFRIVFTYSATDALNMAMKGLLEEGDDVVISAMEHNSVVRPLKGLERDGKITLHIIPCDDKGYIDLDEFSKVMAENDKIKLVVISHASNVTGAVQPIAEIGALARDKGAFFLVDAAQTAGVIPISLEQSNIDMLVFAGHKGFYGLQGTGGLVIGDRVENLRPWREGGTGFDSKSETQPSNWPEAFESGTPNVLGIISLGEGLNFIQETGIDKIAEVQWGHFLTIWNKLSEYEEIELYGPTPEEERIAVLSFNIKGWDPEDVGKMLNQNYGILVRTGMHCAPLAHRSLGTFTGDESLEGKFEEGTVRVSPGYFTTKRDVKQFLLAIRNITNVDLDWF